MDREIDDILQLLEGYRPPPTAPVALAESYLRLVERVERLPENASRADKTWVWNAIDAFDLHYRHAVRIR